MIENSCMEDYRKNNFSIQLGRVAAGRQPQMHTGLWQAEITGCLREFLILKFTGNSFYWRQKWQRANFFKSFSALPEFKLLLNLRIGCNQLNYCSGILNHHCRREKKATALRDFSFNICWDKEKGRELEKQLFRIQGKKATNYIRHWATI